MLQPDTLDLLRSAATIAQAKKAFHLTALDVSELTSFTDAFLLCSTSSDRHLEAVATEIQRKLRDLKRRPMHVEGGSGSSWILMDYGDFIIHVFTEERRNYYKLESLWGDAPKVSEAALGLDPAETPS